MMMVSVIARKHGLWRKLYASHDGGECNMPRPMRQKVNAPFLKRRLQLYNGS